MVISARGIVRKLNHNLSGLAEMQALSVGISMCLHTQFYVNNKY